MNNQDLPEAYAIGWVPFVHADIHLDSRPLIPRTETEYWVDIAIKDIQASGITNPKVLDLCAGSGAIGVAVAKDIPSTSVDFVEIDETHHATILKNLEKNGIELSRARIFGGDHFEKVGGTYDFILSNPPYIDKSLNRVSRSVQEHEPALALYGGKEGMVIINKILREYPKHLNSKGKLYLEHEPEQTDKFAQNPSYRETFPDQFGRQRFSCFTIA